MPWQNKWLPTSAPTSLPFKVKTQTPMVLQKSGRFGTATALQTRPQTRFTSQTDAEFYRRKKSSVVVRHESGDKLSPWSRSFLPATNPAGVLLRHFWIRLVNCWSTGSFCSWLIRCRPVVATRAVSILQFGKKWRTSHSSAARQAAQPWWRTNATLLGGPISSRSLLATHCQTCRCFLSLTITSICPWRLRTTPPSLSCRYDGSVFSE